MLKKSHKHSIKQTVFAFVSLAFFGIGLGFVLQPNLLTLATSAPKKEDVLVGKTYSFPNTDKSSDAVTAQPNYKSKTTNKYLVQSQNLPVYIVKSVVDGNTVILEDDVRVRLIGIKAPDNDEEYGVEATDFLKKTVEGKDVFFQVDDKNKMDSFGRLRGIIYLDRKNINIEILRNGYAHIYPTTPSIVGADDWKQFEDEAMQNKRGLWSGEKSYIKKNTLSTP